MIRGAAREKNDAVFGSLLDPVRDVRNKEKSRNKLPVPFQVQPRFLTVLYKLTGVYHILPVQAEVLRHD